MRKLNMKRNRMYLGVKVALIASPLMLMGSVPVLAQNNGAAEIEEITVVGSRGQGRTAIESMVPVDQFQADEIESVGYQDMNDAMRVLSPSFSVEPNTMGDGTVKIRPPRIRNLPASFSLMTINNKRRHKSALISGGNQFSDMAIVPPFAVKSIEVLRDGSSAQYGSDAIAGVYNFNLKDNSSGGRVRVSYGQASEGDGETMVVDGNIGLPLTDNGFLSLSITAEDQKGTIRTNDNRLNDLRGLGFNPRDPIVKWGQPGHEVLYTFWNAGLQLNDTTNAYLYGNYTRKDSFSDFGPRLGGHSTGPQRGPFAAHRVFGGNADDDPSTYSNKDESEAYPGVYNLYARFPNGFTPYFGAEIEDFSTIVGVDGEFSNGITYDLSYRYGINIVDYYLHDTVNPSLGNESPTSFRPGILENREWHASADFGYQLETGLPSPVGIYWGASLRDEAYSITQGDTASWAVGPLTDRGVGSDGFAGLSPDSAGTWSGQNVAFYIDVEADLSEQFQIGIAGRYDDFDSVGSDFNVKGQARFNVTDGFAIRGSVGTGFFAPTAGQVNRFSITSAFDEDIGSTVEGNFPANHPVAQYFGAVELGSSEATTYSIGLVYQNDLGTTLEVTAYKVEVDNRLTTSANHQVTAQERLDIADLGFANAESLTNISFLQNTESSEDSGVDVVLHHPFEWDNGQSTDATLSLNFNSTDLIDGPTEAQQVANQNIRRDVISFEHGRPHETGNLFIQHHMGALDLGVRFNYYSDTPNAGRSNEPNPADNQINDSVTLVDLSATYQVSDTLTLQGQILNVFDEYPEEETNFFGYYMGQQYRTTEWNRDGIRWRMSASYSF
jgi:iron complex outermembrane recepter protein